MCFFEIAGRRSSLQAKEIAMIRKMLGSSIRIYEAELLNSGITDNDVKRNFSYDLE